MLLGSFESKLTEKNRIAVPKRLRVELDSNLILARGYEGCVLLLDEKRWKSLLEIIGKEPILNLSVRDTYRFIIAGAFDIELDSQGRLVLPQTLKDYGRMSEEVVFLGMKDWIEIWDKDLWESKLNEITKSAVDIADRLMNISNVKAQASPTKRSN